MTKIERAVYTARLEADLDLVKLFKCLDAEASVLVDALAQSIQEEKLVPRDTFKIRALREVAGTLRAIESEQGEEDEMLEMLGHTPAGRRLGKLLSFSRHSTAEGEDLDNES